MKSFKRSSVGRCSDPDGKQRQNRQALGCGLGQADRSFDHPDGLYYVAFSPDGARILSASGDTAKLWNAASGKLLASLEHRDTVPWAGFSPDGTRILTVSRDKTAKLWDAATPVELARQLKEAAGEKSKTRAVDG